jgi:hypothetical protein
MSCSNIAYSADYESSTVHISMHALQITYMHELSLLLQNVESSENKLTAAYVSDKQCYDSCMQCMICMYVQKLIVGGRQSCYLQALRSIDRSHTQSKA